jgi:tetratricopeptide (TPR) repeat protein
MNAAFLRIAIGDHEDAVCVLDQVDLHALSASDIAHWLNARAYSLALTGHVTEALEHLRDAEDLLVGIEDTEPVTSESIQLLASCIIGTRGIALLHGDSLDEAEIQLEKALALGAAQLAQARSDQVPEQQRLAAERLWWLAAIAEKRRDASHRLDCLRRASKFADTRYGIEARKALELIS